MVGLPSCYVALGRKWSGRNWSDSTSIEQHDAIQLPSNALCLLFVIIAFLAASLWWSFCSYMPSLGYANLHADCIWHYILPTKLCLLCCTNLHCISFLCVNIQLCSHCRTWLHLCDSVITTLCLSAAGSNLLCTLWTPTAMLVTLQGCKSLYITL